MAEERNKFNYWYFKDAVPHHVCDDIIKRASEKKLEIGLTGKHKREDKLNKKDLYKFDMFVDRLLMADAFDVKIIEDFSELDASNVSDDIVENTEDTMTLLEKYINELNVTLDKNRLKNTMKALYNEAQDLEL